MNQFFVILFSVLSVAYAGIYSAKWPVNGQVPAKLSIKSGLGMQWADSSLVDPLEESEIQIANGEELKETPSETAGQRFQRQDSPQYVYIGSIYNEPPKIKSEEQYKPKHVRSVTLIQEADTYDKSIDVEVPETPASTSRTPIPSELRGNYESSNIGYPLLPVRNNFSPSAFPPYLDVLQSTLPPANRFPVHRDLINLPFYQALAVAQSTPGYQSATASSNSYGISNGAGASSVAIAQNFGGFQSASSWTNIGNTQSQASSVSDGNLSQNFAVASNQNGNGLNGIQSQSVAQTSNLNGDGSDGSQYQNVAQSANQIGDGSDGSQYQNVGQTTNQNGDGFDGSQLEIIIQPSNQNGDGSDGSQLQTSNLNGDGSGGSQLEIIIQPSNQNGDSSDESQFQKVAKTSK